MQHSFASHTLAGSTLNDGSPAACNSGQQTVLVRLVAAPQHASAMVPTALAASLLCQAAMAAPGDLDPAFGDVGRSAALGSFGPVWAIDAIDDEVLFAGGDYYCGYYSYYCTDAIGFSGRLLGTGERDPAYAAAVLAHTVILDIAAQSDGKAVGVGYTMQDGISRMTIFRLLPDGALDTGFDVDGVVHLVDPAGQSGRSLVIEPDGRVTVAGNRGSNLIVVRLLADGTLDPTFGTAGVYVGPAADFDGMRLLRAPGGGYRMTLDAGGCRVFALDAGGVPDGTFGTGGLAPAYSPAPASVVCADLAVQGDGALLVAGTRLDHGFVTRLLSSGARDSGFSATGVDAAMKDATALTLGSTGSIFVAGHDKTGLSGALVVRLQADGFIDTLFGKDGAALVDVKSAASAHPTIHDMQVLADGNIAVAGGTTQAYSFVARLLGEGSGPGIASFVETAATVITEEAGQAVVNVRRIGGSAGAVSVAYQTEPGNAVAGSDYTHTSGRLDWGDGDTGDRQITVPIVLGSESFEPDEYFGVTLSDPQDGAGLGTYKATVGIPGDVIPAGVFSVQPNTTSIVEGPGSVVFIVSRLYYSVGAVSVTVTPVGQSASAGTDFVATPVTLTWADGDSSAKTISVTIVDDKKTEDNETFSVALSAPTGGAVIAPETPQTVTINDEDRASGGGGKFGALIALLLGFASAWRRYSGATAVSKAT